MLFAIGLLALVAVVGFALTLRAVAELRDHVTERFDSLADFEVGLHKLTRDQAVDAVMQSKITRSYLVEILEKRLLPHFGYKEPEKTDIEKFMLQVWHDEVEAIDCGSYPDDAPEPSETNQ